MPFGAVHLQLGLGLNAGGGPDSAAPAPPPAASTAREFNGTNSDYLTAADSTSLRSPSTALTVGFWLKLKSVTQINWCQPVYKQRATGQNTTYLVQQASNAVGRWQAQILTSGGTSTTGSTAVMSQDTWYYLVARWSSGGKINLDIYNADGTLFDHQASAGTNTGSLTYGSFPLFVGNGPGLSFGVNADLAQVYIDNTSLSDADVQTLIAATQPHAASAGYWVLGVASPDPDTSGNGNDFTVHGTTIVAGP